MQHEITIIIYNPTTDTNNWTADVYLKSFDPSKQDGEASSQNDVRDGRLYCGKGGLSKQKAVENATIFIQKLMESNFELLRDSLLGTPEKKP